MYIEEALLATIDSVKAHPLFAYSLYTLFHSIQYLKAMGGKLVVPNVDPNHLWTGEKIRALAGQGHIYIKTMYPLILDPVKVIV